jgi:hypothetical protein
MRLVNAFVAGSLKRMVMLNGGIIMEGSFLSKVLATVMTACIIGGGAIIIDVQKRVAVLEDRPSAASIETRLSVIEIQLTYIRAQLEGLSRGDRRTGQVRGKDPS